MPEELEWQTRRDRINKKLTSLQKPKLERPAVEPVNRVSGRKKREKGKLKERAGEGNKIVLDNV